MLQHVQELVVFGARKANPTGNAATRTVNQNKLRMKMVYKELCTATVGSPVCRVREVAHSVQCPSNVVRNVHPRNAMWQTFRKAGRQIAKAGKRGSGKKRERGVAELGDLNHM